MADLSFMGVPIKTDESMLTNKIKVIQTNGKERVFDVKNGAEVIDLASKDPDTNSNGHKSAPVRRLKGE